MSIHSPTAVATVNGTSGVGAAVVGGLVVDGDDVVVVVLIGAVVVVLVGAVVAGVSVVVVGGRVVWFQERRRRPMWAAEPCRYEPCRPGHPAVEAPAMHNRPVRAPTRTPPSGEPDAGSPQELAGGRWRTRPDGGGRNRGGPNTGREGGTPPRIPVMQVPPYGGGCLCNRSLTVLYIHTSNGFEWFSGNA